MPHSKFSPIALVCLLSLSPIANAAELGEITVNSRLHENLNGTMALLLSPSDLKSKTTVKIAPIHKMVQAGVVINDNLHKIHLKRVGSTIKLYSKSALENPKVDLLLEIKSKKQVSYSRLNIDLKETVINPVNLTVANTIQNTPGTNPSLSLPIKSDTTTQPVNTNPVSPPAPIEPNNTFNLFNVVVFLTGILSILGLQRFNRLRKPRLTDDQTISNSAQSSFAETPNSNHLTNDELINNPKTQTHNNLANITDDFDFDFDFSLPKTKNQ